MGSSPTSASFFSMKIEKRALRFVSLPCRLSLSSHIYNIMYDIHTHVAAEYIWTYNIYSTLFKTQERESDRRRKEIEQRKESPKTHTNKTTRTCDPKY